MNMLLPRYLLSNFSNLMLYTASESEFWHIHNSVYSGIFGHIQAYTALWISIHAYWAIIIAYSDLFSHVQNSV